MSVIFINYHMNPGASSMQQPGSRAVISYPATSMSQDWMVSSLDQVSTHFYFDYLKNIYYFILNDLAFWTVAVTFVLISLTTQSDSSGAGSAPTSVHQQTLMLQKQLMQQQQEQQQQQQFLLEKLLQTEQQYHQQQQLLERLLQDDEQQGQLLQQVAQQDQQVILYKRPV